MSIDSINFKDCLSNYATGITVITTRESTQNFIGITISSFTSLSLDPNLIMFSINNHSSSLDCLRRQQQFTISILSMEQQDIAKYFARNFNDKSWDNIKYHLSPKTQCPVIEGAIAYIECNLHEELIGGDHIIIIGEVVGVKKMNTKKPLIHFRRNYTSIT